MSKILIFTLIAILFASLLIQNRLNGTETVVPSDQEGGEAESSADTTETSAGSGVSLNLSGRGLTETPEYVFSQTNLEMLDLSDNALSGSLQGEVRHLQNLRVLDLSNNQFTGLPAEVGQLQNLEVLDLSNNQLTGLPYELGNLSNLKVLDLRGNNYSEADLQVIRQTLPSTAEVQTK